MSQSKNSDEKINEHPCDTIDNTLRKQNSLDSVNKSEKWKIWSDSNRFLRPDFEDNSNLTTSKRPRESADGISISYLSPHSSDPLSLATTEDSFSHSFSAFQNYELLLSDPNHQFSNLDFDFFDGNLHFQEQPSDIPFDISFDSYQKLLQQSVIEPAEIETESMVNLATAEASTKHRSSVSLLTSAVPYFHEYNYRPVEQSCTASVPVDSDGNTLLAEQQLSLSQNLKGIDSCVNCHTNDYSIGPNAPSIAWSEIANSIPQEGANNMHLTPAKNSVVDHVDVSLSTSVPANDPAHVFVSSEDRSSMIHFIVCGLKKIEGITNVVPESFETSIHNVATHLEQRLINESSNGLIYKSFFSAKVLLPWLEKYKKQMDDDINKREKQATMVAANMLPPIADRSKCANIGATSSSTVDQMHRTAAQLLSPNLNNMDHLYMPVENMLPSRRVNLALNMLPKNTPKMSRGTSNRNFEAGSLSLFDQKSRKPSTTAKPNTKCSQSSENAAATSSQMKFDFSVRLTYDGNFLIVVHDKDSIHTCRRSIFDIVNFRNSFSVEKLNPGIINACDPKSVVICESILKEIAAIPHIYLHPIFRKFFKLSDGTPRTVSQTGEQSLTSNQSPVDEDRKEKASKRGRTKEHI